MPEYFDRIDLHWDLALTSVFIFPSFGESFVYNTVPVTELVRPANS